MPSKHRPASRLLTALATIGAGACTQSPPAAVAAAVPAPLPGCLEAGDGSLQADLHGAVEAELAWQNAQMQCEGGLRPDGKGIRIMIAGPLPASPAQPVAATAPTGLRFIFGIDLEDTASGAAQALPTNLTVIVEGSERLYATRGDDKCAVENLERTPIAGRDKLERVSVRGYCIGPASDLAGETRLHMPTFSFTALMNTGGDP
jgi:hypothetical protein